MRRRDFIHTSAGFLVSAFARGIWAAGNPYSLTLCRPCGLKEINPPAVPDPKHTVAIVEATLIDGRGGPPVSDSVVVIRGYRILAIGSRDATPIPPDSEVIRARGQTILPGLIDAHFHMGSGANMFDKPAEFLSHGITSLRDPGRPIEIYEPVRQADARMPRCFLTGEHLDQAPPAHPHNAVLVETAEESRFTVNRLVDEGASAIKVYFRLPLALIKVACETAHERGVPVTAHLELVDADQGIHAGLDGIEHVSSFGTALADTIHAERFRTAVAANNEAREKGRYDLWATLDLHNSPRVKPLLDLIVRKNVFVSPTLGLFEQGVKGKEATSTHVRAFENMLEFVGMCHRAGAYIVAASHGPYQRYQRELELLVEQCGLTPMQAIVAATLNNARFFRAEDRLGSVEPGKLADLLLIEGDPLQDIRAIRQVRRVMLNGKWVASNVTALRILQSRSFEGRRLSSRRILA